MDMAGFAVNILHFLSKPGIKMGFYEEKGRRRPVKEGHLETGYLENFASRETVECRGSDKEVRIRMYVRVTNLIAQFSNSYVDSNNILSNYYIESRSLPYWALEL